MNILISGGSGFLGTALSEWLHNDYAITNPSYDSINITWLTRDVTQSHPSYVTMMGYEAFKLNTNSYDVIINLAGAGIADKRWTDERKRLLFDSRLMPTQAITDYIIRTNNKPKLLISGSAVGWYGARGAETLDENSEYRKTQEESFAHDLCERWEKEATSVTSMGVNVAIIRTGIVIHPEGGMISRLLLPFKMGGGGKLGDGKQIMSWISREDWVRAVCFIMNQYLKHPANKNGNAKVYNLTAPNPVNNAQFTKTLGDWLNRPTFMTVPAPILKAMFGEMSTLLLNGQKVLPNELLNQGFEFNQPLLKQAL